MPDKIICPACGTEAACDCGVPYIKVEHAIAANPEKIGSRYRGRDWQQPYESRTCAEESGNCNRCYS